MLDLLKKNGYTSYKIQTEGILSRATEKHIKKNLPISTKTIDKLCKLLDCQPADLLEYVPDKIDAENPD